MSDIAEYKLVTASSANDLGAKVTASISEGWQPYGYPIRVESPECWVQEGVNTFFNLPCVRLPQSLF
jgi:uncharacterized protein DUF1737